MNRTTKIILTVLLILVLARLALPYFVTNYVNKVLADIEGYTGSIDDVDISLYRGAYQIHGLELFSVQDEIKTPFVAIKTIDLSVEWKALFDGAVVGEVLLLNPELNFAAAPASGEVQTGEENDWTKTVTDLIPLQINRFEINNGKISYIDNYVEPKVDIYFNEFNAVATNLNNSTDSQEDLPSNLKVNSLSIGNGRLVATADLNILKEVPDFDLNVSFEDVNIPALNDFFKAYAGVDAESGSFNFYTEVALIDKELNGYFKPLTKDLKVLKWSQEEEKFFGKVWEGIVGLAGNIIENHGKDQVGTKVPISGNIENFEVGVWKSIIELLKNAYFAPLKGEIDKSINPDSVKKDSKEPDEKKDDKVLGIF